ncbi:hypothetical protein BTO30_00295 [Domibacillus antri]|uniref:Uncharacterized protein n=1 Tax=Domibacillus antri TaxID=1714264 RepID=A0A1Q8Q980_9BACI|nr:Gfo/Idh/MocA family oxidoreductase [Domibacillus antri]OLN23908.1 hypothetical protein BTO30_00295 [Domibacillus antri]
MTNVRWGILSAANIAYDELVPALRRSEQAIVYAVASKSAGKAERFNVPVIYDQYEQLLDDPSIDAVYIPLPNALHVEWAVKAMQKGKHVLLEKPAALTEADMGLIKEAANQNRVVFMEAFMYQFHQQHKRMKDLYSSGLIGEYKHLKAHFSWMLDDPEDIRLNRVLGGGAMRDVGCYGIHALTQLIGFKPVSMSMTGKIHPHYGVDTTSTCVMIDEKQRTAEVTASMELPFLNRYEIIGEKGSITVDSSFRPDVSDDQRGKITVKNDNGTVIHYETVKDDQYVNQVNHFQACVLESTTPSYHAGHSAEMARYLEKAYASLDNQSILTNV